MRGALGPCDDQPMAKTVLIVDDHAPFRALARALLQLEGSRSWARRGKW
jgi:CheY-like chemotaxis protein